MEFVKLVGPFAIFFIMYSLGLKLTFILEMPIVLG